MKLNFKKLGPLISEVSEKNHDGLVNNLLGISIEKKFMKSQANTIGTDMRNYKVVKNSQFVYGPVTSRNSDKISISLFGGGQCIVSTSYIVFEINQPDVLNADYLMLWFSRPEFDRYARYMSHGSAREVFSWEEMCNLYLPIPTLKKQKEIVKKYKKVINRILLNEKKLKNLENLAKLIYKRWFIDYEFPISKEYANSLNQPSLEGKSYNTNKGEMYFIKEIEKAIPISWQLASIKELLYLFAGGDKPKKFSKEPNDVFKTPIFSNSTTNDGLFGYTELPKIMKKSITISARGGIGFTMIRLSPYFPIVRLLVGIPKNEEDLYFLYRTIQNLRFDGISSAQQQLTIPDFEKIKIELPDKKLIQKFWEIDSIIIKNIENYKKQNKLLKQLAEITFSKLSMLQS